MAKAIKKSTVVLGVEQALRIPHADSVCLCVTWGLYPHPQGYPVDRVLELIRKENLSDKGKKINDRKAIVRAIKMAGKGNVISIVDEESGADGFILFQVSSSEIVADKRFGKKVNFLEKALVKFDKVTGDIECDCPVTKLRVEELFVESKENYKTEDIRMLSLGIFGGMVDDDCVPLRREGGAYILSPSAIEVVHKWERVLMALNPRNWVTIFQVLRAGVNEQQVAQSILRGKKEVLRDYKERLKKIREDFEVRNQGDGISEKILENRRKKFVVELREIEATCLRWQRHVKFETEDLEKMLSRAAQLKDVILMNKEIKVKVAKR